MSIVFYRGPTVRTPRLALFALFCLVFLPSCSLSGLDRVSLPTCVIDADCAALLATVENPTCDTFVCVRETGRCQPAAVDDDRDGDPPIACGGGDCNENASSQFTGATEICNGIDDDCDGLLDGPDEDDDADGATDVCAGAGVANDCDDTDPFTYVFADELCDGIDNDCVIDGATRQVGGRRADPTEDRDGDGHAAVDATCLPGPTGDARFFPIDDCDDAREDVYAGADELCDGVDNDCDGVLDDAPGSTEPGTTCRPVGLYAGGRNTCVLDRVGDLVCWGANNAGQLGDVTARAGSAIVVGAARGLTSLSFGDPGACGVTSDGGVRCWGQSYLFGRQLSTNFTAHAPERVVGVEDAVEVAVGQSHACARTSMGTVMCFGFSCPGPFLDGSSVDCTYSTAPVAVPGITDAVEIGAGGLMSCARRAGGEVWCWGFNVNDRLGTGSAPGAPAAVRMISDATRLEVGGSVACAVRASGELWCWGDNMGCVGAACPYTVAPRVVPLDGTLADVVLGGRHGCVLYDDGRFGCWGTNDAGQLAVADPAITALRDPRTSATTGALEIAAGATHTCVRREDEVRCWGAQTNYELGDGRDSDDGGPFSGFIGVPVSVTANAMQIAASGDATCFRLPDLSVVCTGDSPFGELESMHPFDVPGTSFGPGPAIDVALGFWRTMVVRPDGRVSTYGDPRYAGVGTADADGYLEGASGAIDAACGESTCCFVTQAGTASCIGLANDGALGDGGVATDMCASFNICARSPVPVLGVTRAVSVGSGGRHSCVVASDGSVSCWGRNERGETGVLPLGSTPLATRVRGLPERDPAVALALGTRFSCALVESGVVWCWGEGFGPLSGSFSVDPLPLGGAANVVQIAATAGGLCVRQRSGVVRCIGANPSGELGDGTRTGSATLSTVLGVTDARDIGCGADHCCATRMGGQTLCWGANGGALGTGDRTDRLIATPVASMLWSR